MKKFMLLLFVLISLPNRAYSQKITKAGSMYITFEIGNRVYQKNEFLYITRKIEGQEVRVGLVRFQKYKNYKGIAKIIQGYHEYRIKPGDTVEAVTDFNHKNAANIAGNNSLENNQQLKKKIRKSGFYHDVGTTAVNCVFGTSEVEGKNFQNLGAEVSINSRLDISYVYTKKAGTRDDMRSFSLSGLILPASPNSPFGYYANLAFSSSNSSKQNVVAFGLSFFYQLSDDKKFNLSPTLTLGMASLDNKNSSGKNAVFFSGGLSGQVRLKYSVLFLDINVGIMDSVSNSTINFGLGLPIYKN